MSIPYIQNAIKKYISNEKITSSSTNTNIFLIAGYIANVGSNKNGL